MASTTFTYNNQEFKISFGQLNLAFPMELSVADFNNIFDLEIVKNTVTDLQLNNFYSLKTIPTNLFNLTNLTILQIIKCNISSLPESIGNLQKLQKIYLQENKIKKLPKSLASIQGLNEIHLEENPLTSTINNVDVLFAIYNRRSGPRSNPIICIDNGFGGLDLISRRTYNTGLRTNKPKNQRRLIKSDFDILYAEMSSPSNSSRNSSTRSNRTKKSQKSSTRSNRP